jgi:nucleoid-associated protein YgaU
MPNDAKLGLVVGVGVVLAVALVFFRKDTFNASATGNEAAAASVAPPNASPQPAQPTRAVRGRATSQAHDEAEPATVNRQHIVQDGETLFTLAELYYGDKTKSLLIYQANQEAVKTPEHLIPGTLLVIPNVTKPQPMPGADG